MATVSVIIPCYNYGHYLRECVESVLAQAGVDVRILIIDDASPDQTPKVAAALAACDARVESIRHTHNLGHIATYNEGLEWASGDYTLLLSADDWLTPGSLLRAARLMDAHPEVGMTYGRQIVVRANQPVPEIRSSVGDGQGRIVAGSSLIESICATTLNEIPTATVVVRTRLQKALGGYRTNLPHTGDMEMWLRFAAHAAVGVIDADQAFCRVHERNMHWQFLGLRDLRQRADALKIFFDEHGHRLADRERLRSLATRKFASLAFWEASGWFERGHRARCEALLDFALEMDPSLRARAEWSHLRWKRLMGPSVWSVLRPLVDSLRKPVRGSNTA